MDTMSMDTMSAASAISLWAKKSDPADLQWMERRAKIKAERQTEFQRVLQQNQQIRAREIGQGSAAISPLLARAA